MRALCRIFVLILAVHSGALYAFDSHEHREIGNAAFVTAMTWLDRATPGTTDQLLLSPNLSVTDQLSGQKTGQISAVADGKELTSFSFGELVAIYGDFAETFEELNSPTIVSRAAALKEIANKSNYTDFPSEESRMIEIATHNVTHFSLDAAQAYMQWHKQALTLAPQKGRLWEALHYEALALHSFSDLFSPGHIIEDREKTDALIKWAEKQQSRFLSAAINIANEGLGGIVNFYHNAFNFKGAMVRNSLGHTWRAYGDGKYRVVDTSCEQLSFIERQNCPDPITKPQREMVVHAAALSIHEILSAAAGKPLPAGNVNALAYVPIEYWDTQEPIHPENQFLEIIELADAMRDLGRSLLKSGFDFSLGYLSFAPDEIKGNVNYVEFIRQHILP